MATSSNLTANIAEHRARQRIERLRSQGRFLEARGVGVELTAGASVLLDAAETDFLGDDEKRFAYLKPRRTE